MKKILLLLFLSFSLSWSHAQRYVKEGATGNGTSWTDASGDLQAMIDAGTGTVYVAKGIYNPTVKHHVDACDVDPRDRSFILTANVKVYGGFSGTDDNEGLDDRNFVLNETILDGDLGGGNNSYHVVFCASTLNTALDGFTIRNGIADNAVSVGSGTTYARNQGGGIYFRSTGSNLELKNLILYNNSATGSGGAGYVRPSNTPTVWTLTNITMYNNTAGASAGGFYVYTASGNPTINLDRIKAYNNSCANYGGAFYIVGDAAAAPSTTTYIVRGEIKNSIFYNNASTGAADNALRAAAVAFGSYTNMSLINSTFYNNVSVASCGAVSFNGGTATTLRMYNNLFAKNLGGTTPVAFDIRNNAGAILDIRNNLFQKIALSTPGPDDIYENNIIEADPTKLFISEDENDVTFLTIKEGPATENGLNDFYVTGDKDFAGNERRIHANVDVGAFEYQGTLPVNLLSFTAKAVGKISRLDWATASETNNQKFVIERGRDLSSFALLREINPNSQGKYSYMDNNPLSGNNYYRLSQVDIDGKSAVLGVEVVNHGLGNKGINVYPVPAKNELTISFDTAQDKIVKVEVISLNGQKLLSKELKFSQAVNIQQIEVSALNVGNYLLVIKEGEKVIKSQVISKID